MTKQVEINISDVQQGSEEWLDMRHGKFTASTFHPLMTMKEDKALTAESVRLIMPPGQSRNPNNFSYILSTRVGSFNSHLLSA